MSGQVINNIKPESFDTVAKNIIKVAEIVKTASEHLRQSYLFECKSSIKEIRTDVFNNAMVYRNKIIPFTEEAIRHTRSFCGMFEHQDYEDFKQKTCINILTKNAKTNEEIWDYTCYFHVWILSDFKSNQDNINISTNKQNLSNMAEKIKNDRMSNGIIDSATEDTSEKVLNFLRDSISNYIKALEGIAGLFKNLHSLLAVFKDHSNSIERTKDDDERYFYFNMIKKGVKPVNDSCEEYFNLVGIIQSNIGSIYEEPKKLYINAWILTAAKKYDKSENLLKLMESRETLKQICG